METLIYIYHDTREWNITSPLYDSLYISPLWYHYTHYIPLFIILSIISHLWIIILIFIPLYPIDLSWIVDIYRYVIFESIIYMINYSILWISHYSWYLYPIKSHLWPPGRGAARQVSPGKPPSVSHLRNKWALMGRANERERCSKRHVLWIYGINWGFHWI